MPNALKVIISQVLLVVFALLIGSIARMPKEPAQTTTQVTAQTESTTEAVPVYLGDFKITGYCACVKCCGIWSSQHSSRAGTGYIQKTASGTIPKQGRTVAADTSLLPFGTVIVIDGHEYVVEDRGGAINGKRIDLFFNSHEDALEWGIQTKKIYIKGDF